MKFPLAPITVSLSLALLAPLMAQQAPETPAWTNTSGVTIHGEFVRLAGQAVVILKDGKEFTIPFPNLTGDSIVQAEKLAKAAGQSGKKAGETPAPVTEIPKHAGVPAPGAWKKGLDTRFPKPGVDRIFLIDRGWVEGRLTALDASSVSLDIGSETLRFPRDRVSLVGLSDWLSPQGGEEIKLRVTLAGTAECATLLFTGGAIIKSVDKPPAWTSGYFGESQTSTGVAEISFDKGSNQAEAELTTDLTLVLPPSATELKCEIVNNRSNGWTGPLRVVFSDPAGGRETASSRNPTTGMWSRFEIPRAKLLAASGVHRFELSGPPGLRRADISTLNLPAPAPGKARHGTARVIGPEGFAIEGAKLDSIDARMLRLTDSRTGQTRELPRDKACWIELHDWQLAWLPSSIGVESPEMKPGASFPVRFKSSGLSGHNGIHFQEQTAIELLIVPPYLLYGLDPNDHMFVSDTRRMGYDRYAMDQSPFHAEFVATLRIGEQPQVLIDFRNHYTNVEPGRLEVEMEEALTGRKIADYKSTDWQLNRVEKFQSSRFPGK